MTDDRICPFRPGVFTRSDRINKCCEALAGDLVALNAAKEKEIQDHINCAIGNFIANVRWRFINHDGPRLQKVTADEPLMFGYECLESKKYPVL